MKVLLLYNNYAANRRSENQYTTVLELFDRYNILTNVKIPEYKHHGIEIIKNIDLSEYDAIIGAGGDGTIFELINGLKQNPSEIKIPFGVVPVGTGNAYARDLGLKSEDLKSSVEAIRNFKTIKTDIGFAKNRNESFYFANIMGFGFVTDVARTAHTLKMFGSFSYTLGVLYHTIFLNAFHLKMETPEGIIERENVFTEVSNSRFTGKDFLMAPAAKIDDGLLDVTLFNKASRLRLLSGLPKIFTGDHVKMKEVETYQVQKITLETDNPKILTPDGEILGETPITVECLAGDLEVIINQ